MREIKFRAKRQHWKEFAGWDKWFYSNGYYFDGINYWFTIPDKDNPAIAWAKQILIDIKTLGEYTGLLSKNGVEIYEGDIVQFRYYQSYVTGQVREMSAHGLLIGYHFYWKISQKDTLEVIGNIYENKELLDAN